MKSKICFLLSVLCFLLSAGCTPPAARQLVPVSEEWFDKYGDDCDSRLIYNIKITQALLDKQGRAVAEMEAKVAELNQLKKIFAPEAVNENKD